MLILLWISVYKFIKTWTGRLDIKFIVIVISEEGTKDTGLGRYTKNDSFISYILFLSSQHLVYSIHIYWINFKRFETNITIHNFNICDICILLLSTFVSFYIFSEVKIDLDLGSALQSEARDLLGITNIGQMCHMARGPSIVLLNPNPFSLSNWTPERSELSIPAVLEN